jgi:glycosyltransferase AglD
MTTKNLSRKIILFSLIGVFNTLVDFAIFNLLIHIFGLTHPWSYPVFKGISFTIACINSYIMNARFAFKSTRTDTSAFGPFLIVTVCGAVINIGIATLLFRISAQLPIAPFIKINAPAVVATAVSMVWNFIFYNYVVFREQNQNVSTKS